MKQRGIKFLGRERAVLEGWRLGFNKVASRNSREGYANIEKDEKGIVEGVLYEIRDPDLRKLDRDEGYPNHYGRIKVRVKLDDKQDVEAITYVAQPDRVRSGLKPSREYLDHLLKGCDLLSEEYCKMLEGRETLD